MLKTWRDFWSWRRFAQPNTVNAGSRRSCKNFTLLIEIYRQCEQDNWRRFVSIGSEWRKRRYDSFVLMTLSTERELARICFLYHLKRPKHRWWQPQIFFRYYKFWIALILWHLLLRTLKFCNMLFFWSETVGQPFPQCFHLKTIHDTKVIPEAHATRRLNVLIPALS